jgi:hypothetical protein
MERNEDFKPINYLYKMIETMLPKALIDTPHKKPRFLEL